MLHNAICLGAADPWRDGGGSCRAGGSQPVTARVCLVGAVKPGTRGGESVEEGQGVGGRSWGRGQEGGKGNRSCRPPRGGQPPCPIVTLFNGADHLQRKG